MTVLKGLYDRGLCLLTKQIYVRLQVESSTSHLFFELFVVVSSLSLSELIVRHRLRHVSLEDRRAARCFELKH